LVNEATLLLVLMPLAPARTAPARIGQRIAAVLAAHRTPTAIIDAERQQMRDCRIGNTASRSVVGVMTEFTRLAEVLAALVAEIRLGRAQVVPVGLRLHAEPHDGDELALDVEQPLDSALRLLVASLAEVVVANGAVRVDEVQRQASSGCRKRDVQPIRYMALHDPQALALDQ
jgi:hypothetical protein